MERVLDLIAWSYNPGGAGNIDEWRVDNPERFEIVPLPNDS
jgi:hypothetical protein